MISAELLIASGFGLLLVLLGWSSQITSRSKETKELEAEFLKKANLKGNEYKRIINKSGGSRDSLFALVDFLYDTKREETDIEIFDKIKTIKDDLVNLDKKYTLRFWILLGMTACLFITGFIVLFLSKNYRIWVLIPNLVFIIVIFYNLIDIYILERKYTSNIAKIMEVL